MNAAVNGEERGASMVEYALLVTLIALIAVSAVTLFGDSLSSEFGSIAASVDSAN
jgi:Flp pilus assembly pilin Flp